MTQKLIPAHRIEGAEAFDLRPGRLIVVQCPEHMPPDVRGELARDFAEQIRDSGTVLAVLPHGCALEGYEVIPAGVNVITVSGDPADQQALADLRRQLDSLAVTADVG